jgi:membrane-bound lytic murein transglycosylase A
MPHLLSRHLLSCLLLAVLSACATEPVAPSKEKLVLSRVGFDDLPGWKADPVAEALPALQKSCTRVAKKPKSSSLGLGVRAEDLQPICAALASAPPANSPGFNAHAFFEQWFTPWAMTGSDSGPDGLFTGYYEASLRGDTTRHGPYTTPIYSRPDDLVTVDLGAFRETLKGQRIAGRVEKGVLKPYPDRAAITTKTSKSFTAEPLAWVDSPIDAFFLEIQGSGRIVRPDGSVLHVGYAAQNGHPYYAIGKAVAEKAGIPAKEVSMQTIRAWLAAHPDEAAAMMNRNPSYVFFRSLDGSGPVGSDGTTLTPRRSLAIDPRYVPYGSPIWLATTPTALDRPLQRLMIAQDTGGAIIGPVRGDMFWGAGDDAENLAGLMKEKGRAFILLPKSVTAPHADSN